MRPCPLWLAQGDIFTNVPILDSFLDDAGQVVPRVEYGPAVLLTHDCAMDKPDSDGRPRIDEVHFTRLYSMQVLDEQRRRTLVGQALHLYPLDALYLGEIGQYGACFVAMNDICCVPAGYLGLDFHTYTGHSDVRDGERLVTAGQNDSRIGRIDEAQLELLRRKFIGYWTRINPEDSPTDGASD